MNRQYILLLICSAILGVAAVLYAVIALKNANYVLLCGSLFVLTAIFIGVAINKILEKINPELRQKIYHKNNTQSLPHAIDKVEKIFRHRPFSIISEAAFGFFMMYGVFTENNHAKIIVNAVLFGFALLVLLHAAYLWLFYSVCINKIGVVIKGFLHKNFLFSDVVSVCVNKKVWLWAMEIKLSNGEKYTFDGLINDFPLFIDIFKERCGLTNPENS